ncbi:hypothetical protein [Kribbella sp. CA-293567]|nr:hypothetical protein [Kribbella sp. CA-293567]WBQ02984.1 hypothetical protein OX958_23740 [Kribbella sp. CA-293567]
MSAQLEWFPELPTKDDLVVDADRRLAALSRSVDQGAPCRTIGHQLDGAR